MAQTTATTFGITRVDEKWGNLKYMRSGQAHFLRSFFLANGIQQVLELGFFHGKSSAYMAAILEEMQGGHLVTMDLESAKQRHPNIEQVIGELGLEHRVTPVYAYRSFTWELGKLLEQSPVPQFDFVYIDGAHTWDGTGFAFLLVDVLLKPGGWVLFDDLDWTISKSAHASRNVSSYSMYSEEEKRSKQVRKVWDVLVPSRGYINRREEPEFHWGMAQKPLSA